VWGKEPSEPLIEALKVLLDAGSENQFNMGPLLFESVMFSSHLDNQRRDAFMDGFEDYVSELLNANINHLTDNAIDNLGGILVLIYCNDPRVSKTRRLWQKARSHFRLDAGVGVHPCNIMATDIFTLAQQPGDGFPPGTNAATQMIEWAYETANSEAANHLASLLIPLFPKQYWLFDKPDLLRVSDFYTVKTHCLRDDYINQLERAGADPKLLRYWLMTRTTDLTTWRRYFEQGIHTEALNWFLMDIVPLPKENIDFLLANGADGNYVFTNNTETYKQQARTPLAVAVSHGDYKLLQYLLDAGADVLHDAENIELSAIARKHECSWLVDMLEKLEREERLKRNIAAPIGNPSFTFHFFC